MEIYPALQLQMAVAALCAGVTLGLCSALLPALRILVGAYRPPPRMRERYEKTLPLLHRSVSFPREKGIRRGWQTAVIAAEDLFLCLAAALAVILLLYAYNSGAFRLSVPLLLLVGFGACRLVIARLLATVTDYLAYGAAVLALYLRAGLLLPLRLLKRFLWQPLFSLWQGWRQKRARAASDQLCRRQLQWAEKGFTGELALVEEERKGRTQHGKKKRQRQDHAAGMGDPHSDPHHFRGVHRHRDRAADQ